MSADIHVGRVSVDSRSILDRQSVDTRSIVLREQLVTSVIPCHSDNFDFEEEKIRRVYVDTTEKFALNLHYIYI